MTPVVSWRLPRTTNSRSMVGEAPKMELRSLEFEKRMILLTYSLALMMLAESVVTLTSNKSTTSGASQDKDKKWKLATAHLIKAQSILWYLAADSNTHGQPLPAELQNQTGFITGLQTLIGGSLHLLIIYKDLERELEDISSGFGGSSANSSSSNSSSSSSTSRSLLSRVAIYAADRFGSASHLISSSNSSYTSPPPSSDPGHNLSPSTSSTKSKVKSAMSHFSSSNNSSSSSHSSSGLSLSSSSETLLGWLVDARKLCIAATHKYTAIDQAQNGQTGQAIGHLTLAVDLLGGNSKLKKAVVSSSKPGTIQYSQDLLKQTILPILHSYSTENNNYTFQKIPKPSELESNRPSGRQVISATTPWVPPLSTISNSTTTVPSNAQTASRNYY